MWFSRVTRILRLRSANNTRNSAQDACLTRAVSSYQKFRKKYGWEEHGLKTRVVITGLGAVSPLGLDVQSTWESAAAGKSGVGPITRFDASQHETKFAAEVKGFDPDAFFRRRD